MKGKGKANAGRYKIQTLTKLNVRVTDLAGGRKAMIVPLGRRANDYDKSDTELVAVFDKSKWTITKKELDHFTGMPYDLEGVTFIADLDDQGWPAIRYQRTSANERTVEYALIHPQYKIIAKSNCEGPTD